jgi:hypothetical protein
MSNMKVVCYKYKPNASGVIDESSVRYTWLEDDLEFEQAFELIKQLKEHRSSVDIYAPSVCTQFYFFDGELCVQIDGCGFWADSPLDFEDVEKILLATYEDCDDFSGVLPGTDWRNYDSQQNAVKES